MQLCEMKSLSRYNMFLLCTYVEKRKVYPKNEPVCSIAILYSPHGVITSCQNLFFIFLLKTSNDSRSRLQSRLVLSTGIKLFANLCHSPSDVVSRLIQEMCNAFTRVLTDVGFK